MTFSNFSTSSALIAGALFCVPFSFAQTNVLSVAPPTQLSAKAGTVATAKLTVQLKPGYHCNSDKPSDEYLIPLKLTWTAVPLEVSEVVYPKPQMEKYSFSKDPLSVYTGDFEIVTKFKVPATAAVGSMVLSGKLRYQACNDRMCLQPKTVDVSLPVDIIR
jgi:DsbC/DsbD-like thiol-disulfide interchange protein